MMMKEKNSNDYREEDHLDPITTTTTNRFATLSLNPSTTTTTGHGGSDHHHQQQPTHQAAPVIFSDPCNACGTMKRRILYSSPPPPPPELQESSSTVFFQPPPPPPSPSRPPRLSYNVNNNNNNKKMKIVSEGDDTNNSNNPFSILGCSDDYSFIPLTATSPAPPPPPAKTPQSDHSLLCSNISNQPITPFPVMSPPSFLPAINSVSFSTPSTSPETATEISKQTTISTPPPSNKKYKRVHSFPVDAQKHQNSSSLAASTVDENEKESPAPGTPSLPPHPPPSLRRSFSDPSSSLPIITPPKPTTTTTTSECQIGGGSNSTATGATGSNAAMKRWRRIRDRFKEMDKWVNDVIQAHVEDTVNEDDEQIEGNVVQEQVQEEIANEEVHETMSRVVEEVYEVLPDENVSVERDGNGDAVSVRYMCCCGRRYQVAFAV